MDQLDAMLRQDEPRVWVFGYGSLTWKPDFSYSQKKIGHICSFQRRFWQGSQAHRGTPYQLGRVATLIPAEDEIVWGVAYEIRGQDAVKQALGGLTTREITLGGYTVQLTSFHPRNESSSFPTVVYMATETNDLFLGGADIDTMAREIVSAKGFAGPNVEYVTKIADYVREHIPEDRDKHLFDLDRRIRELLDLNNRLGDAAVADGYDSEGDSVVECNDTDVEFKCNDTDEDGSMISKEDSDSLQDHLTLSRRTLTTSHVDPRSFSLDDLRAN